MEMKKRLIDANALLLEIEEELAHESPFFNTEQNKLIDCGLRIAAGDIRHQPTVDAVEVVRCKDCKHYHPMKPYPSYNGSVNYCCRSGYIKVSDNDFCSYGEKREEHQQDCTYNKNGHCIGQKLMPECDAKNCDRRK